MIGIKPLWESEHNNNGYHFQCELEVTPHTLDLLSKIYEELWASFVFGLIGEECDYSREINGMRYLYKANKTSVRVEIWIKSALSESRKNPSKGGVVKEGLDEESKIYDAIYNWMREKIGQVKTDGNIPIICQDHRGKH